MKNLFQIDRLQTKSLTKQICDGYRAAIAEGRLKGGEHFPTCREICDEFGVSMIVSAAVVRQLGREGLIRSRPHSGSFVVPKESMAWRDTVLFVNSGGTFSAYAGVLSAALRENLVRSGFLFESIEMPSRFIGKADVARLSATLAKRPKLAVLLHARPEVIAAVEKAGIEYVVVDDGAKPYAGKVSGLCRGSVFSDYSSAISNFVEHCKSAGVENVLEIGFEKDYASAVTALRRAKIKVSTLRIRETPEFCHYGHVQRAGLAAVEKLLLKGKGALPDLVYFTDDYLASGALISFARHGVCFPRDTRFVSLATKGFEPVWWQEVTRLEWDWFAQGEYIASQIKDLLEFRIERIDATISPEYIKGETFLTACARGGTLPYAEVVHGALREYDWTDLRNAFCKKTGRKEK
jgi:DNA-binding transcriptional regulator YhcF (GntR family)/DNA-binding LacI/PurR family transcriptional regulator